jgi:hypothetical protein
MTDNDRVCGGTAASQRIIVSDPAAATRLTEKRVSGVRGWDKNGVTVNLSPPGIDVNVAVGVILAEVVKIIPENLSGPIISL